MSAFTDSQATIATSLAAVVSAQATLVAAQKTHAANVLAHGIVLTSSSNQNPADGRPPGLGAR
jgi:hypothetical protein